jgi:hypothetical protein
MKINKSYIWTTSAIAIFVVSTIAIHNPTGNPGLWFGLGMCCATLLAYCKCDQFWPVSVLSKEKKSREKEDENR